MQLPLPAASLRLEPPLRGLPPPGAGGAIKSLDMEHAAQAVAMGALETVVVSLAVDKHHTLRGGQSRRRINGWAINNPPSQKWRCNSKRAAP